MNKSELKNGCVVELRNGAKCIKIEDILLIVYENNEDSFDWVKLDNYNDDLTSVDNDVPEYDIVKVDNDVTFDYSNMKYCAKAIINHFSIPSTQTYKWTWERKEDILTDEEREYLKAVIAPVKEYVVNITKCNHDCISGFKHIRIELNNYIGNYMTLDNFEYYVKFKGMELGKKYTLDELGLE